MLVVARIQFFVPLWMRRVVRSCFATIVIERGRYLTGLWKATGERAAPPPCFHHAGQPFGRLLPARKSTGSGRLLPCPKMVGDREYAGHTVGADAGEVLVGLGLNDTFQADVAVLDDDVDWGNCLQSVAT